MNSFICNKDISVVTGRIRDCFPHTLNVGRAALSMAVTAGWSAPSDGGQFQAVVLTGCRVF